jgi:hypothetical protein
MSGIYQLNQATGSVTLPISGNTFIGTTPNSELFSVDPAGTVTIYGTEVEVVQYRYRIICYYWF